MDAIQNELVELLIAVIVGCVGYVSRHVVLYLKQKGIVDKINNNRELVKIVVNAIEQTYGHLDGASRFELAKNELIDLMKQKKINISEKEIDLLIEAVVKEIKESTK